MSLSIRHLTNGENTVFTVSNTGVTPPTFEIFNNREDIDMGIRHYVPTDEPMHCEPDLAYIFGVGDLFYPNFKHDCGRTDLKPHNPKRCIAESCRYHAYSGEKEAGQCPHIGTPKEYIPFDKRRKI